MSQVISFSKDDNFQQIVEDSRINNWYRIWIGNNRVTAELVAIFESKKHRDTKNAHAFFIFKHQPQLRKSHPSFPAIEETVLTFSTINEENAKRLTHPIDNALENHCEQIKVRFKITNEFCSTTYWATDIDDAKLQYIADEEVELVNYKSIEIVLKPHTGKPKFMRI